MSPVAFPTKIRAFAKVRSLFSRISSSLFKYLIFFFQNESVKAVKAQTFPPGVRNGNAGVSRREIAFSIRRRDNHALGVTLGRYRLFA